MKLKVPRFLHKFYANFFGYFWLPCSLCGRWRGGHEKSGHFIVSWFEGKSVCENCIGRATLLNQDFLVKNPLPPYYMSAEKEQDSEQQHKAA